jgi:TRAP-type C4-dicarboxylate transport system substrate-binding protein
MESGARRDGLTRRRFVWSGVAGGLVAAEARFPGRALAQARPKVTLKGISVWEKPLIWSKPLLELADRVEKKSGGELVIEWRGGPESVPPFQSAEAVSKGVFDIVQTSSTFYGSAVPDGIAIYPEKASVKSLHAAGAVKLLDEIHREKLGVVVLGVTSSGIGFTFVTKAPVRNLEFFKGKKIRSLPLYTPLLRALGAATVTIAPAEVYPALERGVVDGVAWPEMGIEERKFHEVAKYLLFPTYYEVRSVTLMNRGAFEKLPPPLQKILMEAVGEVEEWGAKTWREEVAREQERLRKAGMEFVTLPEPDAGRYLKIARDAIWEQVMKDSPKYGARLREAFTKAAQMG